jgi:two-component system nitrogen regulation response regulator GlnG
MRDKALLDVSTVNRGKRDRETQAPGPVPALTVVSHPRMERVGSRLLLEALAAGRPVAVSRSEPDFSRPGERLGEPLADTGLSRKPLWLSPGSQPGSVRVDAGESRQTIIPGLAPSGPWELSAEQVAQGVPLELAERIVVLLHLADPLVNEPADALGMVGTSMGIQRLRRHIEKVAGLSVPVLIRGETGSGKELIAQAIHQRSRRRDKPFVSVNLGAITKELAAAELFGARKGAFTGAETKKGFFHAAHGGTLFLDEVGEAPLEVQVALLRVLELGEFYPVGDPTPVKVDVRLVAATDAQLERQIQEGRFREPLLHRLAGYDLRVPPLRERREDIGLLFHHFAREELAALDEEHPRPEEDGGEPWLPAALASRLVLYRWPGNIRQLRNLTRQIVIGSQGLPSLRLDPQLEQELSGPAPLPAAPPASKPAAPPAKESPRRKLADYTEEQIVQALEENTWEIKKAAERLDVARSTLYDWLKRSPHVRLADGLGAEELARHYRECQGQLDAMTQRLKLSRWALVRRLKELGILQDSGA